MKVFLIIVAIVIGIAAVFVAMTYSRYHPETRAAKARLLAGSEILKTDHGDIEYAVLGGEMSCYCMGLGYDQGLWRGKLALGMDTGSSRYRALATCAPRFLKTRSSKHKLRRTKALLDHLNIEKDPSSAVRAPASGNAPFAHFRGHQVLDGVLAVFPTFAFLRQMEYTRCEHRPFV